MMNHSMFSAVEDLEIKKNWKLENECVTALFADTFSYTYVHGLFLWIEYNYDLVLTNAIVLAT